MWGFSLGESSVNLRNCIFSVIPLVQVVVVYVRSLVKLMLDLMHSGIFFVDNFVHSLFDRHEFLSILCLAFNSFVANPFNSLLFRSVFNLLDFFHIDVFMDSSLSKLLGSLVDIDLVLLFLLFGRFESIFLFIINITIISLWG